MRYRSCGQDPFRKQQHGTHEFVELGMLLPECVELIDGWESLVLKRPELLYEHVVNDRLHYPVHDRVKPPHRYE